MAILPLPRLKIIFQLCRSVLSFSLVIFFLILGWKMRNLNLITPQYGLGYAFGIIGLICMIVLMLYPLRKRWAFLFLLGHIKIWFKNHMILGIIGPLFILYHANFHLGALNSNVALLSMLVVAASGIFGRFIYSKIHYGLYGQRATILDLKKQIETQKAEIYHQIEFYPQIRAMLTNLIDDILNQKVTFLNHFKNVFIIRWRVKLLYWKIWQLTRKAHCLDGRPHHGDKEARVEQRQRLLGEIRQIFFQAVKLAEYSFYSKIFSVWHLLHVPLVWIMFIAIIIHVVAVHLY